MSFVDGVNNHVTANVFHRNQCVLAVCVTGNCLVITIILINGRRYQAACVFGVTIFRGWLITVVEIGVGCDQGVLNVRVRRYRAKLLAAGDDCALSLGVEISRRCQPSKENFYHVGTVVSPMGDGIFRLVTRVRRADLTFACMCNRVASGAILNGIYT